MHTQSSIRVLPVADVEFPGHDTQSLAVVSPVVPEYVPVGHVKHVELTEAPVVVEYFPGPQLMQKSELGASRVVENFPAGHRAQVWIWLQTYIIFLQSELYLRSYVQPDRNPPQSSGLNRQDNRRRQTSVSGISVMPNRSP